MSYYLSEGLKNLDAKYKSTKRASLYWDGTVRKDMTPTWASRAGEKISPIPDQTDNLNMQLILNNAVPTLPQQNISQGGITFSINALDGGDGYIMQKLQELVGKAFRSELEKFIQTDEYKNSSDLEDVGAKETGGKQWLLKKVSSKVKSTATKQFMSEKLRPLLIELKNEGAELSDIANVIINSNYSDFLTQSANRDPQILNTVENFDDKVKRSGKYNVDREKKVKPME